MISKDKQYRTKSGRKVEIHAIYPAQVYGVFGAIKQEDGGYIQAAWNHDGSSGNAGGSPIDLVEVKPRIEQTVWLNVYDGDAAAHSSRGEADEHAGVKRIDCIAKPIDCEHGEGL